MLLVFCVAWITNFLNEVFNMKHLNAVSFFLFIFIACTNAQTKNSWRTTAGEGISQHPFLYVGEWDMRHPEAQSMFLVRDGKLTWKYSKPIAHAFGGHSGVWWCDTLSNGNIVFACIVRRRIITPGQKSSCGDSMSGGQNAFMPAHRKMTASWWC